LELDWGNVDFQPDDAQRVRWRLLSEKYVKEAIKNVEIELARIDQKIASRTSTPMSIGYWLEMDISPLVDDNHANYY